MTNLEIVKSRNLNPEQIKTLLPEIKETELKELFTLNK